MKVVILIAVFFSGTAFAEPVCDPGKGQWTLSNGTVQCRTCPGMYDFVPGKAIKLPLGCMAPIDGALLHVEDYLELKTSKEYAQELENWRINLVPTLDLLQLQINEAAVNLSEALEQKRDVTAQLVVSTRDKEVLQSQIKTVIITSSVAAVLLSVPLIILVTQ